MNILDVSNLRKTYTTGGKKTHAVKGVSFSIKKGEIFGLLGPNGAGKSTTINILSGLLMRDGGSIRMFGKNFDSNQEWIKSRMNVASAYFGLSDLLTVRQNLKVYSKLYGVKNYEARIAELIKDFELEPLEHKKSYFLSSGERTRLNLCKGLINNPDFLLLDECTVGLDPEIGEKTRTLIMDYKDQHDLAILFTSHYMFEVEELCKRIAFMSHGRIWRIDSASNLKKLIKKQKVEMKFLKPQPGVKRFLNSKGIDVTFCDEHTIHFEVSTRTDKLYKIMNQLFKKGIKVRDMHIQRPTLDDIFIHVARRKLK